MISDIHPIYNPRAFWPMEMVVEPNPPFPPATSFVTLAVARIDKIDPMERRISELDIGWGTPWASTKLWE